MHQTHLNFPIATAVLTVSDTRTIETDKSGKEIIHLLQDHHHEIVDYKIVKDDFQDITSTIQSWCEATSIQVIIINGGTGFSPRDVTYEAVSALLDKEMYGFGELFRSLSFDDIGARAMFSRAIAGCCQDTSLYALPGSTNAVKLAMQKLIIPTMHHFVEELHRK
ncbi:molybdenum cofactor biosynthesis protein B [Pullulanibacillus pueri]|uniref:Molybdenum cofactor biosynthesis protein B n=1 Tax=Pullulanibacillus pueri TaxID=1437324 RepID=A0A8J2ZYP1_9BACL|nr:MogA/MoaB family molybdenum cofactor biosynthesis protein [Pullulanibacillus pueri]MBM7681011.1 molybdenum cofactor biosynthesis protein B [Pullulanibacillus pueri]GGH86293.1 molybdenum cofactor biosynthesis protein B [Pullulanibacillus pueri]